MTAAAMTSLRMPLIVGIDVGGTFTDITLCDTATGESFAFKVLSDREAPDRAILVGLAKANIDLDRVRMIVHGTTIATNALLERRGARAALVTTEGFRDVVELGRTTRMVPNTLYDPYFRKPAPLINRRDRHVVKERVESDGRMSFPINREELSALGQRLEAEGIEAVAVCFLNSYRNPEAERAAKAILRERFEFVSASHEVLNEIREYERFSTCAVNTYVMPVMARYVRRVVSALAESQYCGSFFTMGSNGGLLSNEMVETLPVRTILSGPAAGVAAASVLMREIGIKNFITCDMGGTSTDVALSADGRWPLKREMVIDATIVKTPQIDIRTIGAGGGSVARLDVGGSLLLGPESAGSTPGPACYGRGGEEVTLTDANAVLGRIGSGQTLGGTLAIDTEKADAVVGRLARNKDIAVESMADGIVKLGAAKMAAAIYEVSVARGYDPREFSLVPFGGAGPLHACLVAAELGIRHVCVPPAPGAFSSFGALCTALTKDCSQTVLRRLDKNVMSDFNDTFKRFEKKLHAEFEAEGIDAAGFEAIRQIDVRYFGQAHEITITLPAAADLDTVKRIFSEDFEREFGRLDSGRAIEVVNVRSIGRIPVERPRFHAPQKGANPHAEARKRRVFVDGAFHTCPIYLREELSRDTELVGPVIVEEMSATLYLPPDWRLNVGHLGELHLKSAKAA
jgi:N-methylhydantoinase A